MTKWFKDVAWDEKEVGMRECECPICGTKFICGGGQRFMLINKDAVKAAKKRRKYKDVP